MFASGFRFTTTRSGRPQPSPAINTARIISPIATPHYWLHLCLQDTKVYTPLGLNIEATSSSSCRQCGYVPRHDTILVNENYQPIETLAGKNLLSQRFTPYLVRCGVCKQTTGNYLAGHPEVNRAEAENLWPGEDKCNNCWHYHALQTFDYNGDSLAESPCQDCKVVNPFGEEFAMLIKRHTVNRDGTGFTRTNNLVCGGPLDRHQNAIRMEWEARLAQHQREQNANAAGEGRKRTTDTAGFEQGMRNPQPFPHQPQYPRR